MTQAQITGTQPSKLQQPAVTNALTQLYKDVEDCKEVLPLIPLLVALGNGRIGWSQNRYDSLLSCYEVPSEPIIFLDCESAQFVYLDGAIVPERNLLKLVAEEFDRKNKLREIFGKSLEGYSKPYDPDSNRSKKLTVISTALKTAREGLKKVFGENLLW